MFSKKPVLPDYKGMSVEERMNDPAWYDVVSRVPGFNNATLVANADDGTILDPLGSCIDVHAGIFTITPERVGYAYAGKHEISQTTRPVQKADLGHKENMFIIHFGSPSDMWMVVSDDHKPYLEGFKQARGYFG